MASIESLYGYSPPIPQEQQVQFEDALSKVIRWKNGLYVPDIEENDKQHVEGEFDIHEENTWKYPTLVGELNDYDVKTMFYGHDGGEPVTGDLASDRADIAEVRRKWKRREELSFHLIVAKQIEDPDAKAYIRGIYRRCIKRAPGDKEAHYADLVDKLQGIRFGRTYVFPGNRLKTIASQQQKFNHCFNIASHPAKKLMESVTPNAAMEVRDFVISEFQALGRTGYRKAIVGDYINQLSQTLTLE